MTSTEKTSGDKRASVKEQIAQKVLRAVIDAKGNPAEAVQQNLVVGASPTKRNKPKRAIALIWHDGFTPAAQPPLTDADVDNLIEEAKQCGLALPALVFGMANTAAADPSLYIFKPLRQWMYTQNDEC